ncbi:Oidioi.mRNA.OKI2018_I69.XSR.g14280.t3.cds [Oikopleura dioica]|uniref:Oidioi.mRNA.OKI2018_I69.XSR.g14280.t3.cds n=1 Tax=Oikopleura dioica TaxID=34765 RepID=A0ABN7SEA7_OIKDI|nr:Oidioi.mRNA.OKI2018_I69.XSR.g14280.t3.cds [Oikopleura dioica]
MKPRADRSSSLRHIPSAFDSSNNSTLDPSNTSASRIEELEISMSEKNDIISRLTEQLDAAGRQIDQMGVKLNAVAMHNNNHFMSEASKIQVEFEKQLETQQKRLQEEVEKTKLLEMTLAGQGTSQREVDRLREDLDAESEKFFKAQEELDCARSRIEDLAEQLARKDQLVKEMEEKQNTHVERQHAQIDQLEQDFRNRQQEADDKLRFLLEEKTKLERQVSQLQEDLEINKDDRSRIREALEEENRYLLSERDKQQELYIAQEKSLTEELRKKDERIAELESEKVNNDNQTFSDSDDDDFHTNIRELDAINDKFYEVTDERDRLRNELTATFANSQVAVDEYERIKAENATLRTELDQSRATHDNYLRLQENHKELQEHLAQATANFETFRDAALNGEIPNKRKITQLEEDLSLTQKALEESESQNQTYSARIKQLLDEREQEQGQFKKLYESAIQESEGKTEDLVSKLNQEIESRGVLLVENKKQWDDEREEMEAKIHELEKDIEYYSDVIKTAKDEAEESAASAQQIEAELQEKIDQLTRELKSEHNRVDALSKQIIEKDNDVKELSGRVATMVSVQDQMAEMSKEWSQKLEELSTTKAMLIGERDQMKEKAKTESEENKKLSDQMEALQNKLEETEANVISMEEIIVDLKSRDDQSREILDRRDDEIKLLKTRTEHLEDLEAKIQDLQTHIETQEAGFNAEREVFNRENEHAKDEIESLVKDYEIFAVQLADKDEKLKIFTAVQEQLHEVTDERDRLDKQLKERAEEIEGTKLELAEAKEKCQKVSEEFEIFKGQASSKDVETSEALAVQAAQKTATEVQLKEMREHLEAQKELLAQNQMESEKLRAEIDVLNSVKTEGEDRCKELQDECAELRTLKKELEELQETHGIVIEEYNLLENELKETKDQGDQLNKRAESLEAALAKALAGEALAAGSVHELEEKMSNLLHEKQTLADELSEIKKREEVVTSSLVPIVRKFSSDEADSLEEHPLDLAKVENLKGVLDKRDQNHVAEVDRLIAELEEAKMALDAKSAENSDFVQQLDRARKDCDQLAAEIVSQHTRLTEERKEFEAANQLKIVQFFNEKNAELEEMEEMYNKQLNVKVEEFNSNIKELNEQLAESERQLEEVCEAHQKELSALQHDIAENNDDRDVEMETLTRDMAELIPYAEQLKSENDLLKERVEELNKKSDEAAQEHLDILAQIQSENNKNEHYRQEIRVLTGQIEQKAKVEDALNSEIHTLRAYVEKVKNEYETQFKSMNQSMMTNATNATEYMPIQIRVPVLGPEGEGDSRNSIGTVHNLVEEHAHEDDEVREGSLPDSDILEMDSKEIEVIRLEDLVKELQGRLAKYENPELDNSQEIEDNQNELRALETKIEELSREREDQLCAKNDHISEIEELRATEKDKFRAEISKLREKISELQTELDKKEINVPEEVARVQEENKFLQNQAEEFADELERTINTEEQLSQENIALRNQLSKVEKELDQIKLETPERFERMMTGFGHERKEFDEVHEKIFEENEQLRSALAKIYSRVKDAIQLANNDALEASILEQHPIGDDEMDLEEGLAATEQVILLLDTIIHEIKQGKEARESTEHSDGNVETLEKPGLKNLFTLDTTTDPGAKDESFTGYGEEEPLPLSPKKPGSELAEMKRELSGLRQENNKLQEELKVLITERLDDANDEVRRMYETLQLNLHEERNAKDEEIRRLNHIVEEQISKEVSNVESLLQQNTELRDRLQFAERECETKTEFITKQTSEQDAERDHLERKVQALQLALEKVKDAQKIEQANTLEESLHNNSFAPHAAQKLEQLETELERERELQNKIQADYNELCVKLESAEAEAQKRINQYTAIEFEKEQLQSELKLAFDRIADLETFIDRLKFGDSSLKSKTMSQNNSSFASSGNNSKAFRDESRLNGSGDVSALDLSDPKEPSVDPAEHAKLAADLESKTMAITDLEEQILVLKNDLEKERQKQASPRDKPIKTVGSLLEDLSEKDNQIFEKEEELLVLQDELSRSKTENEKLKSELANMSTKSGNVTNENEISVDESEFKTLKIKCEMQEEIIGKMARNIELLKATQDHDESLCDFSLKDELNITDGDTNGPQGDGPLVDFDQPANKSSDSIESKDENEKVALLEGTVAELHNELELAESRVAELLKMQAGTRKGGRDNSILLEVRDELEAVNDERESLLQKWRNFVMTSPRSKMNVTIFKKRSTSECDNLKQQIKNLKQESQKLQNLEDELHRVEQENHDIQALFQDAQEEIKFLSAAKMENAKLLAKIDDLEALKDQVDDLEQDKRELDFKISQGSDVMNKLRTDKSHLENEVSNLNKKLIANEVRQQEQQQTINELLNQIQTNRADVEHNKSHAREQESMFIKQQNSKMEEINDLRQALTTAESVKEDLSGENFLLKQRVTELENQLGQMAHEAELSATGEDLMARLQHELDQQDALDMQLLGHLTGEKQNQESGPQLDGRIQSLLDRIHEEGVSILALSEAQALRGDNDIAQHRAESSYRRLELELEQEKILNRDLQEAVEREQHRLKEAEMTADSDKRQIELLSSKLARASQDHGDKCLEVSRCLADIEMLKEEIEAKSQQLEHSQQVVDTLRKDSEEMRNEFSKFDAKALAYDEQSQDFVRRLKTVQEEKHLLTTAVTQERDENSRLSAELRQAQLVIEDLKSNNSADQRKLEQCVQRARESEASEKKLNDRRKLMAMAKVDGLIKKEQRLQAHIRSLELRLQNASSANSDLSSNDGESDKQNLYQVRCGLEACRQQLGALASRLMVAAVRNDNDELKASKEEITEAHRNLAFYARLINSSRSSKRAQDTGLLEERLRDQLTNLKLNSDRLHELQAEVSSDSQSLSEFKLRSETQRKQIDQLTADKLALQNKLDEIKLTAPDQWTNENSASATQSLARKQQKTYERYARAESSRKALVYQKKYLLLTIGGFQNTEQVTLATLSKIGGFKNPAEEKAPLSPKRRFIAAANAVIAITRLKFLTRTWVKRITKNRSHSSKDALQIALTNRLNYDQERGVY